MDEVFQGLIDSGGRGQAEMSTFMAKYSACIRGAIYDVVYNAQDRQDVESDTYLHIIKNNCSVLRQYKGSSTPEAYLRTVARNMARQAVRKSKYDGDSTGTVRLVDPNGDEVTLSEDMGSIYLDVWEDIRYSEGNGWLTI